MSTRLSSKLKSPKVEKPPKLKGKTGAFDMTEDEQLDLGQRYISAQAKSASGALILTETEALKTAREAVLTRAKDQADARALFDEKTLLLVDATREHKDALEEYAYKAAKVAKGDIIVLASLGVDAAAIPSGRRAADSAGAVTGIRVLAGPTSGSAIVRWPRPAGAAAFLAQYMLDPAPGTQAEWVPSGGFATKNLEWKIEGLPPGAQIRVRIQAIGAELGPWSDEVLGKAR